MPSFEAGPLPKKLPELHKEPQIERAVEKSKREGDKVPNTPEAKIGTYLNRLDKILTHTDERQRDRNLMLLKPFLHDEFVVSEDSFPEAYFELQKRIYRERGQAVEEFTDWQKQQMIEVVREDQTKSLDDWVDYLASDDAGYPTWFKYLAFRNITKLSQFDKEKGHFKKRSKDTVAPYPDIYREALGIVADKLELLAQGDPSKFENDEEYKRFAEGKFADLYAEAIQRSLGATVEGRENIKGNWVRYARGDMEGADKLYESLQGRGTGWCTAGKSTAENQISHGDFYVYYTFKEDADDQPTQPRIAIRMNGDEIAEVRGVLAGQEVEPPLHEVVNQKLDEFGSKAEKFKKKAEDMRRMTELESKQKENREFDVKDLEFLYEIHDRIEGFGYGQDPRIKEMQEKRGFIEDYKKLFQVDNEQELLVAISASLPTIHDRILDRIIEHVDEFKELRQQELFNFLLNAGSQRKLAEHIHKFTDIDFQNAAESLIAQGEGQRVMNDLRYYKNITDLDTVFETLVRSRQVSLAINLIRIHSNSIDVGKFIDTCFDISDSEAASSGRPRTIAENIQHFPSEYHPYIAEKLLESGHGYLVAYKPASFDGLDQRKFIDRMCELGQASYVLANFNDFNEGTDYQKVLESCLQTSPATVAEHLYKLPEVDTDSVAERLISMGHGLEVVENSDNFPSLNLETTLLRALDNTKASESHLSWTLVKLLKKHRSINPNLILQKALEKMDPTSFSMALRDSTELEGTFNLDSAERLLEGGRYSYYFQSPTFLKKFDPTQMNEVAELLLNHRCGDYVAKNIGCFPELDQSAFLMKLLMRRNLYRDDPRLIVHYKETVGGFSELNLEVAELLILRNLVPALGENLDKFKGLTEHVAKKLIGNGYQNQVASNLASFNNLLPETLESLRKTL